MPIYEYYCTDCKEKFELLRPFSRIDEPAGCPKCKKGSKRILSRFASFSKDASGNTAPVSGGGGGCSTCGGGSCSSCN